MIQRHLIAIILISVISRANAFSYNDAQNWGAKYKQCNGRHQSPIKLDPAEEIYPSIAQKLKFTNFNKLPTNVTIKNTGHTVEVKANWSGKPPTVSGGPLHGEYVFEKTTFHWDEHGTEGYNDEDEDSYFDNPTYPLDMEMHMFFYKTDLKSFEKAQTKKGGLAVFNIGLRTDSGKPDHFFDNLEKNVHKVQSPKSPAAVIHPFRVASILGDPHQGPSFISYDGSLDYPPCFESVTWFIYDSELGITKKLVNEFRKIKLTDGDNSNLRPIQEQFSGDSQPKTVGSYIGKDE